MRYNDGRGPLPPEGLHAKRWKAPSHYALKAGRIALYRFYAKDNRLLYIGISNNPGQRFVDHSHTAPWWNLQIRHTIEWHPNRLAAEQAERFAVQTERPIWNVVHAVGDGKNKHARPQRSVRRRAVADPSENLIDHKAAVGRLAELAATVDVRSLPFRKRGNAA